MPASHHSIFDRPDALPDAQPTLSKNMHRVGEKSIMHIGMSHGAMHQFRQDWRTALGALPQHSSNRDKNGNLKVYNTNPKAAARKLATWPNTTQWTLCHHPNDCLAIESCTWPCNLPQNFTASLTSSHHCVRRNQNATRPSPRMLEGVSLKVG